MYVDIWCTVSVCVCELCLFMKNVSNFELIKINKIQKKTKNNSNLVTCHFFPNFGKPFRFSVVFWKEKAPAKPEFCVWLASTTWDQCTYIGKIADFLWYGFAGDGDKFRFFLLKKALRSIFVIAQIWRINLPHRVKKM